MVSKQVNVGMAGWGLAGRYFHAPFIKHTSGLKLAAVVTSREVDTRLFPDVQVLDSYEEMLADESLNVIVIATPDDMHVSQALSALGAGKHIVVEKPVARTLDEMHSLIVLAGEEDRLVIPFQNRRWDGDFRTVKRLVDSGTLGEIHYYESRWPKYQPLVAARAGWKTGADQYFGLLYDLGVHLLDQALHLFGMPATVYAQVAGNRPGSPGEDWIRLNLEFPSGVHALLEVDFLNPMPQARFHVRGGRGTFEKFGLDPQEDRLVAGAMPEDDDWGVGDPEKWGHLITTDDTGFHMESIVKTLPGDYRLFYQGVHRAVLGDEPPPVSPEDVLAQLRVLDAARQSAKTGLAVQIQP
jgi:scyllo-inositol 2-dehydrogenase (NADP+)